MAAYVIYQGEVLDPARYDEYKTKAALHRRYVNRRYVGSMHNGVLVSRSAVEGKVLALEHR